MTTETKLPPYLPYARFLLSTELTQTAKLIYTLLLDRTTLSQKNGWVDEQGRVYVIFTIKNLSAAISRSAMTVKNALSELEAARLIERKRIGFASPNLLYVKLLPCGQETCPVKDGEVAITGQESCLHEGQKDVLMRAKNLTPNNLNNSDVSNSQRRGERETPTRYGRYDNVALTDAELNALQAELPDCWQRYIEQLSEYIASTGRRYKSHLATIRRWAAEDARKTTSKTGIPNYTCKEDESL